jgi:hypothetical protein
VSAPNLRRRKLHRWFEEKVVWSVLDARDWLLRRDNSKPLYDKYHQSRLTKMRWALIDGWERNRSAARWRGFAHHHRAGAVAFVALPIAVAAGLGVVALGSGGGQPSAAPVAATEPPARVEVAGVTASSEDADRAARRERAAQRRERAAARRERAAATRQHRAADRRRSARRHRAAVRRRAAARRARARRAARRAPARPVTRPPTTVSAPATPPRSATPAPVRPQAPARPPSRPSSGSSQPAPGVKFDDAG